ncbi:MAG: replication-relaxation family protein [Actinomycetota bacterium]|nr:replication-relaxation family protein [Actinomycetota bacterium]
MSTESARVLQPNKRRRRIDRDELRRISEVMPERDREVLHRIDEHRYLTTHQIQSFVFTDHGSIESAARTTRYVLARLEHLALIRALPRRVGGVRAGSAARIWQLAPAGARLLRDEGQAYRSHEPSLRFLQHCLAVADVHLGLRYLTSTETVETIDVATEPNSWRRYIGPGGEQRLLQPDLASVVRTSDYVDRWFIEVDLGTESLPTVLKKCGQYETYRASGIEQDAHQAFPLVIWIFMSQPRAEKVKSSILRSPRLTPNLYRVTTIDGFAASAQEWLQ